MGKGADVIRDESEANVPNGWEIKAGKGNDKFYISNGSNKQLHGQDGNDYFELTNGECYDVKGGLGNDTFVVSGGTTHYIECNGGNDVVTTTDGDQNIIYGNDGNDTFTVTGGNKNKFYGGEGRDTFNTFNGKSNEFYGGDENDTFTINGSKLNKFYGNNGDDVFNVNGSQMVSIFGENDISDYSESDYGNDTYNINTKSETDIVSISDYTGKNTINISNGFKGYVSAGTYTVGDAEYKLKFDKSYKLTSSANVNNDGTIKTNDSNITIYRNFEKENGNFDSQMARFIINTQNELSNDEGTIDIIDRAIDVEYSALTSVNVGGKNYTLNLDNLKQELVAWFSTRDYADSNAVFTGGDANDIQSLMAVYTNDTASCFVKV